MELRYKGQFFRDLSSYKNKKLLEEVKKAIESVKRTSSPEQIPSIKKLDPKNSGEFITESELLKITG